MNRFIVALLLCLTSPLSFPPLMPAASPAPERVAVLPPPRALVLLVADEKAEPGVTITAPAAVQVAVGRMARIEVKSNGKSVAYYNPAADTTDIFREYDPDASKYIYRFLAPAPGVYKLNFTTSLNDALASAEVVVTVGVPVPPKPPDPPKPPEPPLPPDPFQSGEGDSAFRVLIVYDDATRAKLPIPQKDILTSDVWRKYAQSKGTWRCFDTTTDMTNAPAAFKKAFSKAGTSLPYLLVGNGTTGYVGPLPENIDNLMKLLTKLGG